MGERVAGEAYVHRIRVRYGEVDMQRVVYNAHYLAYCDDACEMWLQAKGLDLAQFGWDFMVKRATVDWAGAATVHDELEITVSATRWGTTSFDVGYDGSVGGQAVFSATVTYVGVRAGTREVMPAPAEVRARLA